MAWTNLYLDLGAGSNGTGTSGSPFNTFAHALTDATYGISALSAAPTRVYVKGTQTLGGALAISPVYTGSTALTAATPVWWCGTDALWNDLGNVGGTVAKPTLNTSTYGATSASPHQYFTNLAFTGNLNGYTFNPVGFACRFFFCRFSNTNTGSSASSFRIGGNGNVLVCNYFAVSSTTAPNVYSAGNSCFFRGNFVLGGNYSIQVTSTPYVVQFNILAGATTAAIYDTGTGLNCHTDNLIWNAGTDSIRRNTASTYGVCCGNAISNGTANTNGINDQQTPGFLTTIGNGFYNQTNQTSGLVDPALNFWPVTDVVPSFTNPAGNDFSLASGSAFRQAGLPGVFEGI